MFVLIVAMLSVSAPGKIADLRMFTTVEDCREAASMAAALTDGPMKAFCLDTSTWEKVGEASRSGSRVYR